MSTTVSFVDMQPSESSRSNVVRTRPQRGVRIGDDRVGGQYAEHGGQARAQHAGALCHAAQRPAAECENAACLGDGVGGADGVCGVRAALDESAAAAADTPASSRVIGNRSPINPVEHTTTSPAPIPSSAATCSAVAWVSANPSGPVHALAPPELSTTARARPSARTCCDQRPAPP
jgi:hypothetical protein